MAALLFWAAGMWKPDPGSRWVGGGGRGACIPQKRGGGVDTRPLGRQVGSEEVAGPPSSGSRPPAASAPPPSDWRTHFKAAQTFQS